MAATENAITVMKSLGAIVTDAVIPQYATQYSKFAAFYEGFILRLDFKVNFAQYLAKLIKNPNNIKSQLDLIKYTKNEPKEIWPDRNVALWTQSEAYNFALTDKRGLDILKNQTEMYTTFGLDATLALGKYDVLVCPTDHSSKFAAIGGHPFITVPMGYYDSTTKIVRPVRNLITSGPNVPFGLAFISSKWSEEKLFAYAYAYEQATMVRNTVKPYILPTAQVAGNAKSSANRLGFSVPLIFALGTVLFSLF
jgi:amidase